MNVYFSAAYCDTTVAFDTTRKAAAIAESLVTDPIAGVALVAPTPVSRQELLTTHTDAYVDAVLSGKPFHLAASNGIGWDAGLATAVCASSGGVRDAALFAFRHRTIAGSLSSGLHHAYADHGSGYCTFNGLVIAARAALSAGAGRVLILDFDAHCGGGTASLIDGVEGLVQVDIAVDSFDRYESTAKSRLTMSSGADYLEVVTCELDRLAAVTEEIGLVLYNAGMDPHGRAGGHPSIDTSALRTREELVFEWAATAGTPLAWVLAGGYTGGREGSVFDMAALVDLHRLTITSATAAAESRR